MPSVRDDGVTGGPVEGGGLGVTGVFVALGGRGSGALCGGAVDGPGAFGVGAGTRSDSFFGGATQLSNINI